MIIDTHAHLYLEAFDEDRVQTIQRAKDLGISKIYLPNIDSSSIPTMHALEEAYPNFCYAMMGLHPCSVKGNYKEELELCKAYLEKRPYSAIGEIGIDLYWDKSFIKQQEEAFRIQIEWSEIYNIPIVIHSRDSLEMTIRIVKEMQKGQLSGIFHCFTGTLEQAKEIEGLGFYVGIGGVVTFKNSGLAEIVREISLDWMVLETDSPYLSPVPYRGKRNESAYLEFVIQKIADVKEIERGKVIIQSTINAVQIFDRK